MPRRTRYAVRGSRRKPKRTGTQKVGGKWLPTFFSNGVADTASSGYNTAANTARSTGYRFNLMDSAGKRIAALTKDNIERVGLKNIMLMYLVIHGAFNMVCISTSPKKTESFDEINELRDLIKLIFGRDIGNLEYNDSVPKSLIVYNTKTFKASKTTYTQEDLDRYMNSFMGLDPNAIDNVDTKNSLFISNKFILKAKDATVSDDNIMLLNIPSAKGNSTTARYLNTIRVAIETRLRRVPAFNVASVMMESFSDILITDLMTKLSKSCTFPKNRLGENGELSVRNYMIKLFNPNSPNKNYEKPSDSVLRELGKHFYILSESKDSGKSATDSLDARQIVIHYKYSLDKNDIQRGVVMGVLENLSVPGFNADEAYAKKVMLLLDKTISV